MEVVGLGDRLVAVVEDDDVCGTELFVAWEWVVQWKQVDDMIVVVIGPGDPDVIVVEDAGVCGVEVVVAGE